jgi:hypothetical protein
MEHFTTLEEIHAEWETNGACSKGVDFNQSCKSLEEIFMNCPLNFRIWRLANGYEQFADHCHWGELSGRDWAWLLQHQPIFAKFCPWKKLTGWDWGWLLHHQPQFSEFCDWEKLSGWDWGCLLQHQPQFKEHRQKHLNN